MLSKRFILAAVAFLSLLPFSGCGCRKSCCSNSSSFAPPPGACCDKGGPGYLPPPSVTP
jgi:hypothetical protein